MGSPDDPLSDNVVHEQELTPATGTLPDVQALKEAGLSLGDDGTVGSGRHHISFQLLITLLDREGYSLKHVAERILRGEFADQSSAEMPVINPND